MGLVVSRRFYRQPTTNSPIAKQKESPLRGLSVLWSRWDSNPLPFDCEPNALPDELLPLYLSKKGRLRDPLWWSISESNRWPLACHASALAYWANTPFLLCFLSWKRVQKYNLFSYWQNFFCARPCGKWFCGCNTASCGVQKNTRHSLADLYKVSLQTLISLFFATSSRLLFDGSLTVV